MASTSLELDDQTDEDFFDKLVNDDIDFAGSSAPSALAEANEVADLGISAMKISERADSVEGDSSAFADGLGEKNLVSLAAKEKELSVVENESERSELEAESGNVKLVQWESSRVGTGFASYSDLFNGIVESSEDPFANVGEVEKLGVESKANNAALDSSSGFVGSRENSRESSAKAAGYGSYSDLFNGFGESSDDPFSNVGEVVQSNAKGVGLDSSLADLSSFNYEKRQENSQELNVNGQDLNSSQYWESVYPGWKYDQNTGQWYQLEGNAIANANVDATGNLSTIGTRQESFLGSNSVALDQRSDFYQLEETAENSVNESVSNWNQVSQGSTKYPANMVFDPQYPGWYFDTISQEWKSLDSYTPAVDYLNGVDNNQQYVKMNEKSYGSQSVESQGGVANWDGSLSSYNQQNVSTWQNQQTSQSVNIGYAGSQQLGNQYAMKDYGTVNQQMESSGGFDVGFGVSGFQSVYSEGSFTQHSYLTKEEKSQETHFSPAQFNSLNVAHFPSQTAQSQSSSAFSYAGSEGRTSAERPPHALVTFGFGGKLVVMKDASYLHSNSAYRSQDSGGNAISVLNLMEVVTEKNDTLGETGACDYFRALCQQSFPGPLVGGNAGSKELNKWIDEKIANYETSYTDYRKGDLLRLLLSLLKISVQYYGKLRSPFGSDQILKENDTPEAAVAKLFASAKRNQEYGATMQCLQNVPSEAQIQATALEVQNLLVSGRKKEALESAQEGQLWGPALVLASQLGDQFYSDTVKKMSLKQLIAGSPLRTLCLLIAGQPADVFSDTNSQSSVPNSLNVFQQPSQVKANCTLDEWTQNLAIVTANRTKDDELVIIHLGDCLWKETGEITAAHICYLVAEVDFELHSESSRLCLIGADHWKFPRTYASPEAIQRTELYEYSKVLGNSQFLLLPFQPYKLVYAHMLAEVGKISDSLKYCQAMLRSLKTGRAPEVEAWKQSVLSLEERIKTHQQGGYGTNLASTKLVGKLLTFFDSTAHRVVGGLPPPVPSTAQVTAQLYEPAQQPGVSGISKSQSAMAMPLLMPSASMEPISARVNDDLTIPNRSISEPDFSRNPREVDSSKKENSSNTRDKTSVPTTGSRFGRFGSQLLQKTVGLVIRSRSDKQAKLGEPNSFYYDEKLKRWVEKGAEPPAEQEAFAPPPTTAAFQSGMQAYGMKGSPQPERFETIPSSKMKNPNPSENNSGIPPIPPSVNQFSARGHVGVRSRYVDTFNKGGGTSVNLFHSPSAPAAKPASGLNPKFFIPATMTASEATGQPSKESLQEANKTENDSQPLSKDDPFASMKEIPTSTPPTNMQRFSSMESIVSRSGEMASSNSILQPHARRTASWSGSLPNAQSPPINEIKPLGEALGLSPSMRMPNYPTTHLRRNSGSFGDELHEVQL